MMRSSSYACGALAGLTLAALVASNHAAPPGAGAEAAVPADRTQRINEALGLKRSRLVNLRLPDPAAIRGGGTRLLVPVEDRNVELELQPHSVRAPGYRLLVQHDGGELVEMAPGPERTLRGRVLGMDGSRVAASLLDDGLHATIDLGGGRGQYWIEPTAKHLPPVAADAAWREHVIYANKDVRPHGGTCGISDKLAADVHAPLDGELLTKSSGAAGGGTPCIAELACDADVEYYIDRGSDVPTTEAYITTIVNNLNVQYERDVDLTHQLTAIVVRTGNRNSDPYSSNDPSALLCEFITEWTNNQTGIQRDVAQLFTGRMVQGGTIGIAADLGDIGNNEGSCTCHPLFGTDGSYSLVQGIGGGDACRSDLSAHELGHLWSGLHCSCTSPDFTMNPSITCANVFSPATISRINTFKAGRTTLDGPCAGAAPSQDVCEGATNISESSTPYSTFGNGTECPGLPMACDEGSGDNLELLADIWFRYTASCTGDATASLCNSNFDTRIAVYADNGCPPLDGDLVACDDDFCGLGSGSQVTFSVSAGESFIIRVGGFGAIGTGTLDVSCDGVLPCPADTDGSMTVDIDDLLALLAAWGPCPAPCPEDQDTDGDVDIDDLLSTLAAWGPCT